MYLLSILKYRDVCESFLLLVYQIPVVLTYKVIAQWTGTIVFSLFLGLDILHNSICPYITMSVCKSYNQCNLVNNSIDI